MHGKRREGGRNRRGPGRHHSTALVFAAILGYIILGFPNLAPALFVEANIHLNVAIRDQGEPVRDDHGLGHRRARNGGDPTKPQRSHRPGETAFADCHSAAAEPVRNRAAEGEMVARGELDTVSRRNDFDRS